MELTEVEISEAFGLETGANVQEPAEPVVEPGANAQEPAQPAEGENPQSPVGDSSLAKGAKDETDNGVAAGETSTEPTQPKQPTREEMDAETRRQHAALRRQQEDAERQREAQVRIDAAYAKAYAGQTDPYTGRPITTEADFIAYQERSQKEAAETALQSAGISAEALNEVIGHHPAILAAQEATRAAKAMEQAARDNMGREALAEELKVISAIDPSIKTVGDLAAMPQSEEFNALVGKGVSLTQAFKLARFDELTAKRTEAAKQSVLNGVAGKGHMTPVGGGGSAVPIIPADMASQFREMDPEITDKEMQRQYELYLKETR